MTQTAQTTAKTYTLDEVRSIMEKHGLHYEGKISTGAEVHGRDDSLYWYCGMGSYVRFTRQADGTITMHRPFWNPFGEGIDSTICEVGTPIEDMEQFAAQFEEALG